MHEKPPFADSISARRVSHLTLTTSHKSTSLSPPSPSLSLFPTIASRLNARDKDERYMAMHDLAADLDRDTIKLDGEMER